MANALSMTAAITVASGGPTLLGFLVATTA